MLKKRKRGGVQEINAGSMADIAFLLLIFFLVTTTMDTDAGILRLLPPIVPNDEQTDIVNQRDVYIVLINDADQLLVEGGPMEITDLRKGAKEFMTNPDNSVDLPERRKVTAALCQQKIAENKGFKASSTDEQSKQSYQDAVNTWEDKLEAVRLIGDYSELPPNALISLQTGSKTSYDMYVRVQNELEAGIAELRAELCKENKKALKKINPKFLC